MVSAKTDLRGCSAWGKMHEEAVKEADVALGLWLESMRDLGLSVPPPGIYEQRAA